jgi:hypothetical protein
MKRSERSSRIFLNAFRENLDDDSVSERDRVLAEKIKALLDSPEIDENSMVDAYYYDGVYLLFGFTSTGKVVSKHVRRFDLDE